MFCFVDPFFYHLLYKTGKSCIVVRFVRDEFFDFQEPTIGGFLDPLYTFSICHMSIVFVLFFFVHLSDLLLIFVAAFLTQTVTVDDATIKFEIWDTAGMKKKQQSW